MFSQIDKFIDINKIFFAEAQRSAFRHHKIDGEARQMEPLRISQVIAACHRNESIFKVLQLNNIINISQINDFPKRYGIDEKLKELADNVAVNTRVRILSENARAEIEGLAQSELNQFAAYKYVDNLVDNITKYNLNDLADRLKVATSKVPNKDIVATLELQQLHLRTYQKDIVDPMVNGSRRLLMLSKKLDELLHFKQTSFEEAIRMLVREIDDAENFLNEQGTDYVQKVARELLESFSRDIQAYLSLVINATQDEVGKCGPISNVYESLIIAACNRVIDPFVSNNFSSISNVFIRFFVFFFRMVSGLASFSVYSCSSRR